MSNLYSNISNKDLSEIIYEIVNRWILEAYIDTIRTDTGIVYVGILGIDIDPYKTRDKVLITINGHTITISSYNISPEDLLSKKPSIYTVIPEKPTINILPNPDRVNLPWSYTSKKANLEFFFNIVKQYNFEEDNEQYYVTPKENINVVNLQNEILNILRVDTQYILSVYDTTYITISTLDKKLITHIKIDYPKPTLVGADKGKLL